MNLPRLLLLLAAIGLCQSPIGHLAAQPAPVLADPTTGALFRPTNLVTPLGNATGTLLGASGGTGVANTGKTITLGGNVTTVGAYNLGVSLSGNTTVTLPTTGTLATLAGSETLTNKTLTSPTLTTPILGAATATSVTAPATTDLTLTGGSTGASLVLGQSTTGGATLTVGSATTPALTISGAASPLIRTSSTGGARQGFEVYTTSGLRAEWTVNAGTGEVRMGGVSTGGYFPTFYSNNAEVGRFSTTGNLLIGTTTDATSLAGGVVINGSGAGATSSSTSTGALRVTGGVGVSGAGYFGGLVSAGAGSSVGSATTVYRATNAGGDITSPFMVRNGSGNQFATHVYADSTVVAQGFDAWNGTRLIEVANIQTSGVTTTAGAEVGGLSFAVKPAGGPASVRMTLEGAAGNLNLNSTTSASSSTVGALTIGNGTAATNVAIGGGNVNAGGTLVVGGTVIHTLTATPASASATGTVGTMSWDASYIYICTATNTWKRVAIATW